MKSVRMQITLKLLVPEETDINSLYVEGVPAPKIKIIDNRGEPVKDAIVCGFTHEKVFLTNK